MLLPGFKLNLLIFIPGMAVTAISNQVMKVFNVVAFEVNLELTLDKLLRIADEEKNF
jgi:hypothetical protein